MRRSGAAGERSPGQCSGWVAWHNRMPGTRPTLHVTGSCSFPTPGYSVTLKRKEPPGINPAILLLERTVQAPAGPEPDVVTEVEVHYEEETSALYTDVTILPDNVTVPVKQISLALLQTSPIGFEEFIEATSRAVLRALDARQEPGTTSSLNPQPLPPGEAVEALRLPGRPIIIGIVASDRTPF